MCAISGIYSYKNLGKPDAEICLRGITNKMFMRGPDGHGMWKSADDRLLLAHRRLSIIDLSTAAHQPMVDSVSECVLIFNGEIYNYGALRDELLDFGHVFKSNSDSEVLLKGYLQWGEGLLSRLRGMFAFALWDPVKNSLWLVRDPYGIKPLYYSDVGGRLAFSSQFRPLRDNFCAVNRPEPSAIVGFLLMGYVPEPYTMCKDIRMLPAGHSVWVNERGLGQPRAYASISNIWHAAGQSPVSLEAEDFVCRVRSAVLDSVKAHQIADVPVGSFLSAGIDSGALLGLMAEGRANPIQTITLGFSRFKGTSMDEAPHAEELAKLYGAQHCTKWISDSEVENDFPQILADMDQPSIDGFNTWLVSKHAAALGLKVVVSGVGGDELFGGYNHFSELPVWHNRLKNISRVRGVLPLLGNCLKFASNFGLVHAKAPALTQFGKNFTGLYMVRRGLFMPWELPMLLDRDLLKEGLATLQPPCFLETGPDLDPSNYFSQIASIESANYLRNQLLRDSDWASMSHSLELRTPLVDIALLNELAPVLAATRPFGFSGKRVLAMSPNPSLPDAVINRPKSGFNLPISSWIENTEFLNAWRKVPLLNKKNCHWARRLAYGLAVEWSG